MTLTYRQYPAYPRVPFPKPFRNWKLTQVGSSTHYPPNIYWRVLTDFQGLEGIQRGELRVTEHSVWYISYRKQCQYCGWESRQPRERWFQTPVFLYIHKFFMGWLYLVCRTLNSVAFNSRELFKVLPPTSQRSDTPCSDVVSPKYLVCSE